MKKITISLILLVTLLTLVGCSDESKIERYLNKKDYEKLYQLYVKNEDYENADDTLLLWQKEMLENETFTANGSYKFYDVYKNIDYWNNIQEYLFILKMPSESQANFIISLIDFISNHKEKMVNAQLVYDSFTNKCYGKSDLYKYDSYEKNYDEYFKETINYDDYQYQDLYDDNGNKLVIKHDKIGAYFFHGEIRHYLMFGCFNELIGPYSHNLVFDSYGKGYYYFLCDNSVYRIAANGNYDCLYKLKDGQEVMSVNVCDQYMVQILVKNKEERFVERVFVSENRIDEFDVSKIDNYLSYAHRLRKPIDNHSINLMAANPRFIDNIEYLRGNREELCSIAYWYYGAVKTEFTDEELEYLIDCDFDTAFDVVNRTLYDYHIDKYVVYDINLLNGEKSCELYPLPYQLFWAVDAPY